eukprot:997074_1
MSIKDLHTTLIWMQLSIALSIISVVVLSILLIIESKSFYHRIYGGKGTSANSPKEASNSGRVERAQSGSEDPESQGTATNIDISKASRSTSSARAAKAKSSNKTFSRLHVLPLLMYICYIVSGIISTLFKSRVGFFSACTPCGVPGIFFCSGKLFLYLIFIYRLHAIYSDTVFQYNTTHLSIMAIICVIYQYLMAAVNLVTVSSVSVQFGDEIYCGCASLMVVPGVTVFADTIVSVVCCCAFIKPLKALQALNAANRDAELYRAVVKNMTLTCVAVITTVLIMICMAALKLNALAYLDVVINSICVFLMNKEHDLWFKYLCFDGKCGSKVVKCCCSTNETTE